MLDIFIPFWPILQWRFIKIRAPLYMTSDVFGNFLPEWFFQSLTSDIFRPLLTNIYTHGKKVTPIFLCMIWNRGNLRQHEKYQKIMPQPWTSGSKKIWIISFKWGTVHSCTLRGCKNIRGQSWRSIRNCRLWQIRVRWTWGPADLADFFWPPTLTSDIFAAS